MNFSTFSRLVNGSTTLRYDSLQAIVKSELNNDLWIVTLTRGQTMEI